MKIKEVKVEKLFSIGNFNNERLGFVAEVEPQESSDAVIGELFLKIVKIETCLDTYRRLLGAVEDAEHKATEFQYRVDRKEKEIAEMKVTIQELVEKADKGEYDAKMRHACAGQSMKEMRKQRLEYLKAAETFDKELKDLTQSKTELEQRIKEGQFDLSELTLPRKRPFY